VEVPNERGSLRGLPSKGSHPKVGVTGPAKKTGAWGKGNRKGEGENKDSREKCLWVKGGKEPGGIPKTTFLGGKGGGPKRHRKGHPGKKPEQLEKPRERILHTRTQPGRLMIENMGGRREAHQGGGERSRGFVACSALAIERETTLLSACVWDPQQIEKELGNKKFGSWKRRGGVLFEIKKSVREPAGKKTHGTPKSKKNF